jgi:DsbC/DsbD-like thiol-disulfide interchange protein
MRDPVRRTFGLSLILAGTVLGVGASAAADLSQIPKDPIEWSIRAEPAGSPFKAGDKFTLHLTAKIAEGWHLYSTEQEEGGPIPTRIVVPADQPFEKDGPIAFAEPETVFDPNFNLMTAYYEETAAYSIPMKVSKTAASGSADAKVNVSFQTCNDQLCLPPKTVKLAVKINLAPR